MKVKLVSVFTVLIIFFNSLTVFANLEEVEENFNIDKIKEKVVATTNNITDFPKINSRIALVYDRASGRVLFERNGNKHTPMASTTKIMTAIVVAENSNLSDIVTIDTKAANTGGSRLGLKKNDKITVNDLLYGLMLKSGNDAAVALAIHIGGSIEGFAKLMNDKATKLGLINTHFVVPHGLDIDGHYTTAYELAKIADYALNNEEIKKIVSTKTYTVNINNKPKVISNTNELLGNLYGVYGVKTGFTNGAGRCLVTACKRDNLDIITVIIGADTKKTRTADSIKLIEYTFKNFTVIDVKKQIQEQFESWKRLNEGRFIINKGKKDNVNLKLQDISFNKMAIKNTKIDNIKIETNCIYYLEAPIEKERIIGNVKVVLDEETLCILQMYNDEEIKRKDICSYLLEFLKCANT